MCTSFKNRCVAVILAAVLLFSTLPFGSFRVFAEGAGQLSTDIGTKTFRVGASEEFTFTTTAGDDAGTMVKGRFTFSDPDALETLEYLESKNGEWYEFSGDFGPETGFPLIDGTSRFRATFQKAGTYTVSAQMVRVDDDSVVCQTEAQVQVVYVNGTLTTDLSEKTFKLHEATEFTFTTTAGDDAGTMVKGRFTFNDQAALEKLEYLESKNGEWYEFSGDFGPETGFPLIDGTSRFRATFQKAGTYTVSAQMVRVDDDSVVCETTASINVAWNAAQLKTDIDKKNLVYGQKTEYTYTTVAGDDAGTMVKGRFTFSDPSALETLEYYEVMDGKWYPLNGEFGPSAGFPLSDATSRFRATFKKAGTFTCTVEIYSVEDQTVLCKDTTKITVQKAELTGISVVGTNNNYDGNEFELVKITGCEQGDKVSYWVNGEEETDTPPKRSAIGSYEVRVVVTRDENHASYEATVASMIWGTIDPGSGLIVQGTYCIYDGKPHDVVTVTRADGEGDYTLKYRMEGEGEDDWRTEIPQVTDAGSYTVYVKATKGNYNDLKVEVKPAEGAKYPFNVCIAKAEQNLVFADGETIEKTWSEDSESNKYTNAVSGGKTKEEVKYSAVADEMSNGLPCAEINEETGEVTFYGAGTVQVTAIKKGDNNYKDAEISYTLTIRRAAQAELRIESSIPSEFTYNENGNKIKLSTTGGSGDGAVTYGIQASPADCVELEGDTLTVRKSGVVQVTATKEKTDTYEAAQSEAKEITIQKATQSIAFEATPETVIYGTAYKNVAEPVEVSQAADRKGYAENTGITYKVIEGEEIASVEKDGSLSWKGGSVGKLTVQAIKAGDDCYKEASAEYTVTVAYAQLPETPYTIEGTRAEGSQGDWYIGDVTITPAEGYSIGETNLTDESKWSTGLVITEEGITEKKIYLRNNEDLGITDKITISNIRIDKTAPTDLQISYKTSLLDTILSVGSIGFYDAPVEVTVSASDDVAPVCEFVITYGDEQKTVETVKKGDAGFSEGKTASATITINPQFRGKVSFTAINEAGLRAASDQEKEPTIVIDNVAPNVTVKYDNYEVENGSYYKTDRTATIQIAEENFFPEAMTEKRSDDATYLKIAVTRVDDNGKETTTNYTDETLTFTKKGNVWEAELSFTENGDYTLVVDYMDFSNNYDGKESHYETSFSIDKTDPVIVVTHENNDAVNDAYFEADRPVKVEITEHNFDPAKVDLTVTARNANGEVADFAAYLKKPNNWKTEGDKHTAEFTFETEASYTFDISVTDLAGRSNQDVSYGESVAPTAFTIDKTDPVIKVTHSNNSAKNGSYFKAERPVKVEITERNFDPAKVDLMVTARNATGAVTDFAAYLKNPDSWRTEGDKHTAEFTFETEADYTFDISVTDLAGRSNQDVSYGESVAPKAFTIDKTAPTDGEITIDGQSVRAENSLAFEKFYREAQSIKFTAKFDISGEYSIKYQKVTSLSAVQDEGKWLPYTDSVAAQPNERFVIYFRAEDRAGNVRVFRSTGIVVDNQAPVGEKNAPEIDILPQAGNENGIHTADVAVSLRVVDPKYLGTTANEKDGYYSGLKEITYRIYAQDTGAEETGTLLCMGEKTVGDVTAENGLVSAWSGSINVSAGKFNSNYVFVEVTAVDNAGNKRITTVDSPIRIDTTAPRISVSYDNNNGDATFANGSTDAFFKEGRTATIVITERNFDPALVALTLTNRTGATPVLSGWRTEQGSGNGDDTRHIATLYYGTDGEYTFGISCKDLAGLSSTAVSYQGLAPQRFTIDRTAPVISVVYDNMDAKNENHYKASRTATITITERNFEQSRLTIRLTATDHGEVIKAPEISAWSSSGDTHTATIRYDADALYSFDISYRDKAGNAADRYRGDTFYVDQTLPKVTLSGIADESANSEKGDIGFVLTATDTNLDEFTPVITAVLMEDGQIVKRELAVGESKPIEDGMEFVVKNLPDDGIYRITCTVTDKAGNAFEEITLYRKDGTAYTAKRTGADDLLTFSVNRSGSVYEMTSYTAALTEKYYVQRVTEEVAIVEINANPLISYVVTLGGKELQEGTDYTVSIEGGSGDWRKYTYHVQSTLFDAEGEYNLVISSVDGAENDAFSDVKGASIHFVVDRTAPVVAVSGLAAGGRYQTTKQQVTLIPTDDGGALKSLCVLLVDDDGETLEELVNLQGEALEKALEENDGKITFEMSEGLYQNVRIICDDCADYGDEENIIYDKVFRNVSVSSSAFMIFWANKPLRWGVIGGVSAVVLAALLVLLLKKRKKKD